jgi:hypothetical protein
MASTSDIPNTAHEFVGDDHTGRPRVTCPYCDEYVYLDSGDDCPHLLDDDDDRVYFARKLNPELQSMYNALRGYAKIAINRDIGAVYSVRFNHTSTSVDTTFVVARHYAGKRVVICGGVDGRPFLLREAAAAWCVGDAIRLADSQNNGGDTNGA